MNKNEFDKLIQNYPPEKAKKGILLFNGVVSGAAAYQQDSSLSNLKSWQAAEAALDEFIGGISNKSDSAVFRNRVAVIEYLKKNNIRIGKSKLYKDADFGKLRVQPDGSVLLSDVELYTRAYLTPKQKTAVNADIEALQKEKLEKENQKLDEQIAKLAWDREKEAGRYLLRSDFEMELAARAAVLEMSLRQMAQTKAYDWVAVCRGEHSKAADMAAMVTAEIGTVLNDYATTDSFQVIFIPEESQALKNQDKLKLENHCAEEE
ncbi:MAG: hypothetical protein KKD92_14040 [Proteobacteria bacterium]|nr:hypothetical protein [Pseudomonadota bacterium]